MSNYFEKVTPESCGIDSNDLIRFIENMEDMPETKETHGFMLLRFGKLLAEGWFSPYTEDMPHVLFSDTKTFIQIAIGFMVQEGLIDIEDKIADYFADKITYKSSEHNRNLTIRHLLMMATGHVGQEVHKDVGFNKVKIDKVKEFFETDNYTQAGVEFQYDNIATYVLSNLVTKITGKNVVEYLKPRFLEPLNITIDNYSTDENGVCLGYSGFRIKLEALAKIGQFFLNKGRWEGKQLLPAEWCENAMKKHTECVGPCGEDWNQGYCWQMWRGRYNTARICGAYGQMCVIVPDLNMVFATNSGANYNRIQYILDNFYENVMFKTSDQPLEENGVAQIKLENKIEKLCLQNIFRPISKRAEDLNGQEIHFDKTGKYDSIKMEFSNEICHITLSGEGAISFDAGLIEPQETVVENGGFVIIDSYDTGVYSASAYFDENDAFVITARILQTATVVKIIISPDNKVNIYTLRGSLGE